MAAQVPTYRPALRADPLREDLRVRLWSECAALGEAAVKRALNISYATLARALAGLGIRPGTAIQIEVGLAKMEMAPPPATSEAPVPPPSPER